MNLLFTTQKLYNEPDMIDTFEKLGHSVFIYEQQKQNNRDCSDLTETLLHLQHTNSISFVFSLRFSSIVSNACHETGIPYVCWCTVVSPELYQRSVLYDTNYLFFYDSMIFSSLIQLGITHGYYLPLAAAERPAPMTPNDYTCDINFVGSLYTVWPGIGKLSKLSPVTLGYLDGILQAQEMIYGYPFLQNLITPAILEELSSCIPFDKKYELKSPEVFYTEDYLYKILNRNERIHILQKLTALREEKRILLYAPEKILPDKINIENSGTLISRNDLLAIYRQSHITLNITNRTLYNGIPQKVFDAMAEGSLVFSNYQQDMDLFFENEKDYICYEDNEDLLEKANYYLSHPEICQKIIANAHKKIDQEHLYRNRIGELMKQLPFSR